MEAREANTMRKFTLTETDAESAQLLVRDIARHHSSVEDEEFLRSVTVYAHEVPRALRSEISNYRLQETDSILIISGYPVDDERIGHTPAHWKNRKLPSPALEEEIFFMLCANLLGDTIAWATQQDGHLMHEIFPIKGHENEQLGTGSRELLTWHSEDAFHPLRNDYLGLMCLRNPDRVETTYASVDEIDLPESVIRVLQQPRFPIHPDRSHLPKNRGATKGLNSDAEILLMRSYEWIEKLDAEPAQISILFGDSRRPYLRADPFFMDLDSLDAESRHALESLISAIDRALSGYALKPGEVLFIDNYRAVHGRRNFAARFDGTDRWMKRLNIARDLRKSRDRRVSAQSRTIH
jgi:Fe(II)/alpha-ketoglutarate-dependent arginine beta-hydroxylase